MQFSIKSVVEAEYNVVASNFERPLFTHLLPKFPLTRLVKFEGSENGDLVCVQLELFGKVLDWDSEIIQKKVYDHETNFTGQGRKLPFFLIYWEHRHRIIRKHQGTVILDEIYYKSPNIILEILIFPFLYLGFYGRKKGYVSFFKNNIS